MWGGDASATWLSLPDDVNHISLFCDICLGTILLFSAYYGYQYGLVRYVLSTQILFALIFLGMALLQDVKEIMYKYYPDLERAGNILPMLVLVVSLFCVFVSFEHMIRYVIESTILFYFDRPLGMFISMLYVALFLSIGIMFVESFGTNLSIYTDKMILYEPTKSIAPKAYEGGKKWGFKLIKMIEKNSSNNEATPND